MSDKPKVLTREDILSRLSDEVLTQRIYKAKVVFMGVLKDDPGYQAIRGFSVNGRRYSVVDGGIAYLPAEAFNALKDAVPVFTVHKDKTQQDKGINYGDPSDVFKKVPNPRYDITILEEFKIGKDEDGKNILVSLTEQGKDDELKRAEKAAYDAIKKELEASIREELEDKIRKEIQEESEEQVKKIEEEFPEFKDVEEKEDLEPLSEEDFNELIEE